MDIDVFSRSELPLVFRVLRTALRPEGALDSRERTFLDTYARIAGCQLSLMDPEPIDVGEVTIEGSHQRRRLVQLAAMAVLLNRPIKAEAFNFLRELSGHFGKPDSVVDVIDALRSGRRIRVRMLAMRRAMRAMLREAHAAEGWRGLLRLVGALLLKAAVNKNKLWDYKRLGLLPEGTLGREYWKHMTGLGFGFPGEPAGIADTVAYHDIAHVLAGHDTTPLGEIQQGSFQGGNRRDDGFFFVQFVILQFHQGIRVTPGAPPAIDNFDPEKVLWAIHRGAKCRVDMTHQWDYWPLMALPLQEARARCGLLPKLDTEPARWGRLSSREGTSSPGRRIFPFLGERRGSQP